MEVTEHFVVLDVLKRIYGRYKEEALRERWPEVTKDQFVGSLFDQYSVAPFRPYEDVIMRFRSTPEIIVYLKSQVEGLPHEFSSKAFKEKLVKMLICIGSSSQENTDLYLAASSTEVAFAPEPLNQAQPSEEKDLEDGNASDIFLPLDTSSKRIGSDNPLRQLRKPRTHKALKKEYFRCQHIRAIKKSIRELSRKRFPKTSIVPRGMMASETQRYLWFQLENLYNKYPNELNAVSDPSPRMGSSDGEELASRSYSDTYSRYFFAQKAVRGFHFLFCDLVYASSINELCEKLRAKCCPKSQHSEQCKNLWAEVKDFAKFDMVVELGYPRNTLVSEEKQFTVMFKHPSGT